MKFTAEEALEDVDCEIQVTIPAADKILSQHSFTLGEFLHDVDYWGGINYTLSPTNTIAAKDLFGWLGY
jgi:hypothetical protein